MLDRNNNKSKMAGRGQLSWDSTFLLVDLSVAVDVHANDYQIGQDV